MLLASSTNKADIAACSLVEDYFRRVPCPVAYMDISAEVQVAGPRMTEDAAPGGPARIMTTGLWL